MKTISSYLLLMAMTIPVGGWAQNLLPKPQKVQMEKGTFRMDKPFAVQNEVGQMSENLFNPFTGKSAQSDAASQRVVRFLKQNAAPAQTSQEAYALRVSPDTVDIYASTKEGFLRACQTLNQLKTPKGLACCQVSDAPAYSWRGVMLDVSRHFYPISFLKKQIDILSAYKINRFHLHLTDGAGWRMEIKRYPRLNQVASWRTDSLWKTWWNDGKRHYASADTPGAYGGYYKQDELRELAAYAAERGILVVPEIEMPGHSEEVLAAYPELSCTHEPYKQSDFCPGNIGTYDFLEHVLEEVMEVFPSPYIHVGGDEAGKGSWKSCRICQQKMKDLGTDHIDDLQTHLITHMGHFLDRHGRKLIGWDEVIAGNLSKNTTVMVWRDISKAREAIEKGYDVVLSPGAYCYLDNVQDAPYSQREGIGGYLPLSKVYSYVPGEDLNPEQRKHIKGLQANLWTEYVPTMEHAEHQLYPRMLAIAETGWKGTADKNYEEFHKRALNEVQQLRKDGRVNAFDLSAEIGERPEKAKPVKHKASGAKVTYTYPASKKYWAAGESTLTDGLRGGWANNDGRWQGFVDGKRLDVTIDLGKKTKVRSVGCDFFQSPGPWIYYPEKFIVSLSEDGQHFHEVYQVSPEPDNSPIPQIRLFQWKGRAEQARYVRVQASIEKEGAWIFTDEIVVR